MGLTEDYTTLDATALAYLVRQRQVSLASPACQRPAHRERIHCCQ
jgi:hypothetical protein